MDTPLPPVVGVDLSLTSTGVVVIAPDDSVTLHRIKSKPKPAADLFDKVARMADITQRLGRIITPGSVVALESPSYGSKGSATHDIAGNWWLFVHWCWANGIPVSIIAPSSRAMYATGRGDASKDAVLAAVIRRYPAVLVDQNDVADGLALAAMLRRHLGHPIEPEPLTPVRSLDALVKPRWAA